MTGTTRSQQPARFPHGQHRQLRQAECFHACFRRRSSRSRRISGSSRSSTRSRRRTPHLPRQQQPYQTTSLQPLQFFLQYIKQQQLTSVYHFTKPQHHSCLTSTSAVRVVPPSVILLLCGTSVQRTQPRQAVTPRLPARHHAPSFHTPSLPAVVHASPADLAPSHRLDLLLAAPSQLQSHHREQEHRCRHCWTLSWTGPAAMLPSGPAVRPAPSTLSQHHQLLVSPSGW